MASFMVMFAENAIPVLDASEISFVDANEADEDVAQVGDEVGEPVVDDDEMRLSAEAVLVEIVVQAGGRMSISGLKNVYDQYHWMKAVIGNLQQFLNTSALLESVSGRSCGRPVIQLVGYEMSNWLTNTMDEREQPLGGKKYLWRWHSAKPRCKRNDGKVHQRFIEHHLASHEKLCSAAIHRCSRHGLRFDDVGLVDCPNTEHGDCFFKSLEDLGAEPPALLREMAGAHACNKQHAGSDIWQNIATSGTPTCNIQIRAVTEAIAGQVSGIFSRGLLVVNQPMKEFVWFQPACYEKCVSEEHAIHLVDSWAVPAIRYTEPHGHGYVGAF